MLTDTFPFPQFIASVNKEAGPKNIAARYLPFSQFIASVNKEEGLKFLADRCLPFSIFLCLAAKNCVAKLLVTDAHLADARLSIVDAIIVSRFEQKLGFTSI